MTVAVLLREGAALSTLFLTLILWSIVGHALVG
ncbi:hypothetical protein GGD88_002403 [Roseospira goensis]|uniref:Uncharacterized protein n=1 Tax=Roseospira goensis TaxID=391922 RepID=A0A7W6S0L1_9PROT|nr:hypothetical protein [Roseospira goensis]